MKFQGLKTGATHSFAVVKIEDVEFTLKDENGKPLEWWYLLETPDGQVKKGKLDANGHAKVERVPKGECGLKLTEDEPADPPPPAPPPALAPPAVEPPPPGEGEASRARLMACDDTIATFEPPNAGPEAEPAAEPEPADAPDEEPPPDLQPWMRMMPAFTQSRVHGCEDLRLGVPKGSTGGNIPLGGGGCSFSSVVQCLVYWGEFGQVNADGTIPPDQSQRLVQEWGLEDANLPWAGSFHPPRDRVARYPSTMLVWWLWQHCRIPQGNVEPLVDEALQSFPKASGQGPQTYRREEYAAGRGGTPPRADKVLAKLRQNPPVPCILHGTWVKASGGNGTHQVVGAGVEPDGSFVIQDSGPILHMGTAPFRFRAFGRVPAAGNCQQVVPADKFDQHCRSGRPQGQFWKVSAVERVGGLLHPEWRLNR